MSRHFLLSRKDPTILERNPNNPTTPYEQEPGDWGKEKRPLTGRNKGPAGAAIHLGVRRKHPFLLLLFSLFFYMNLKYMFDRKTLVVDWLGLFFIPPLPLCIIVGSTLQ